jgi:predicted Zn-ribbon and HTH transcriptional regulator
MQMKKLTALFVGIFTVFGATESVAAVKKETVKKQVVRQAVVKKAKTAKTTNKKAIVKKAPAKRRRCGYALQHRLHLPYIRFLREHSLRI